MAGINNTPRLKDDEDMQEFKSRFDQIFERNTVKNGLIRELGLSKENNGNRMMNLTTRRVMTSAIIAVGEGILRERVQVLADRRNDRNNEGARARRGR